MRGGGGEVKRVGKGSFCIFGPSYHNITPLPPLARGHCADQGSDHLLNRFPFCVRD